MSDKLTHFDAVGQAHMVDVADKAVTRRIAIAEGWIRMRTQTLALIAQGSHKKGEAVQGYGTKEKVFEGGFHDSR